MFVNGFESVDNVVEFLVAVLAHCADGRVQVLLDFFKFIQLVRDRCLLVQQNIDYFRHRIKPGRILIKASIIAMLRHHGVERFGDDAVELLVGFRLGV